MRPTWWLRAPDRGSVGHAGGRRLGADVILVEKMEVLGSSTTRSEGYVQAAGTELQRENGVEDSVEALYEDIYSLYKDEPEVDAELIKQAAYDSTDYIQFLLDAGRNL